MRNFVLLSGLLLFLISCKKEKFRIPGSFHALQQLNESRSYPNLDIPSNAYGTSYKVHQSLRNNSFRSLPQGDWEAIGPKNTAGRTLSLAINPQSDETIYLGSASGGLWRSRTLGLNATWEYMPIGFPVLAVSAIEFAFGDSTQMYIGTGEVYNIQQTGNDAAYRSTRGVYGMGILKSTDGGATWIKSLDWTYQNQKGIQAIKVHPDDPNKVYAATTDGVYYSQDAGVSWQLTLARSMVTDLLVNGNVIIAACGNFGTPGKGLYRSGSFGELQSWQKVPMPIQSADFQGKILLDHSSADPANMYASVGNGFWFNDGATWVLRSSDNGGSWVLINDTDYSKWQGWFSHDIAIDPFDEDNLVTVGIEVWKSEDKGQNLLQTSLGGVTDGTPSITGPDGPPEYVHSDNHVVMYHPTIKDMVLIGSDGGLFISKDNAVTFRSANGNLQTAQFYNGFSVSQQDPEFAMGGLQDNSTSIYRGDGAFQRDIGGDGSWTGINHENDNFIFGSSQNLRVLYSDDRGISWSPTQILESNDEAIFIAPFALAPSNPEVLYAGGRKMYKTDNPQNGWIAINDGQVLNGELIYCMDISPTDQNIVMVATAPLGSTSSLFITIDGSNFDELDVPNIPNRFINDISFDPIDPSIIYITVSGFGTGHLFRTEDFGLTWDDISQNLPDVPGNAIIIDPLNTDHIYYGNDFGVYFSDNLGDEWQVLEEDLYETVIAMDLKISQSDRKLWLATHGNGLFRMDLIEREIITKESQANLKINVFPNPVRRGQKICVLSESQFSTAAIRNVSGETVQSIDDLKTNMIQINVDCGIYFFVLGQEKNRIVKKIIVIE